MDVHHAHVHYISVHVHHVHEWERLRGLGGEKNMALKKVCRREDGTEEGPFQLLEYHMIGEEGG